MRDAFCPDCRGELPSEPPAPTSSRAFALSPRLAIWALKLVLFLWLPGAVLAALTNASWEARLIHGNAAWIVHLGEHPAWKAPPTPDYTDFANHFREAKDFPGPGDRWRVEVGYDSSGVALNCLAFTWPGVLICGLLYRVARGSKRDLVLHCALSAAVGVLIAVTSCFAIWCALGGWGPPLPVCFVLVGLIYGFAHGAGSFRKRT